MNLTRSVWLPPDGDPRLVRFQQTVASVCGFPDGVPCPVHLELSGPTPRGTVRLGAWVLRGEEPVVSAFDDGGAVGYVHFGLPDSRLGGSLDRLPPVPAWTWTRGRLARLDLTGDESFVTWSWGDLRGWRGDLPTP